MATEFFGGMINNSEKAQTKFQKAIEKALINPPEVKVGITPHQTIFSENKLKLLHYEPRVKKTLKTPLIVIFALINKPYILDLKPGKSVVEILLNKGIDVYLIDWGIPGDEDKHYGLNQYINRYIRKTIERVKNHSGSDKVSILGYCMGGTMSVIYCALYPEDVENLILLSTGVDFGVDGTLSLWNDKKNFDVDKFVQAHGNVPAEYLQTCFLMMKPVQNFISKYINFYENVEDDKFVKNFVAMEKWLGDNIPLAGEVFREFVKYFYQQNLLIKNKLRINGKKINLKNIRCPVLNLIAQRDHLVPPASSTILNKLISSKDYKEIIYPTGHIGMSVSGKSINNLWPEAAKWLAKRSR